MYDQPGQRTLADSISDIRKTLADLLLDIRNLNGCRFALWELLQEYEVHPEFRLRAVQALEKSGWFDDMLNAEWIKDQISKNPKDREDGGHKRFLTENGEVIDRPPEWPNVT